MSSRQTYVNQMRSWIGKNEYDGSHKEINVPEEEFLENQYLQDYYEEDEKYLERPEAQQFYKD